MIQMGTFNVNLPDEVENKFRREIALRMGIKKGNITIALVEAIEMWRRKRDQKLNKAIICFRI